MMYLRRLAAVIVAVIATSPMSWAARPVHRLDGSYDYIVVGGGAAGSIVASRLSEDPDVTVALLEAGEDNENYPFSKVPLMFFVNSFTSANWEYKTVPQTNACNSLEENRSNWISGKVLGGSGQLNAMWYVRGSRHDYDRWANEFGADGWSYADVLPYFKKSEGNNDPDLVQSGYHGENGPWKVSVADGTPELIEIYLRASEELGATVLRDINGREQEAFSPNSLFIGNGARSEPAVAFLKPAMRRNNLDVLTGAHVTRVLFDGNRAVGVEYRRRGVWGSVFANREVILSAGAIASPRILMSSGVGHRDHLEQFGIPVVADLPVGDNLQDHTASYPLNFKIDQPVSITIDRMLSPLEIGKYLLFREGLFSTAPHQGIGFFRSEYQPADDPRPYMKTALASTPMFYSRFSAEAFGFKPEVVDSYASNEANHHGFSFLLGLEVIKSKGTIRLQSSNPFDHPLIDPKYYDEDIDVENMLSGIRFLQQFTHTQAFQDAGVELIETRHPLCEHLTYDSDDYWRCVIRGDTITGYHWTSTCKMGPRDDNTTVVDSQLRVHGIEGLRVADASVMPEIPTGNTMAPTVMVAELASDIIRGRKLPPITDL